MSLHSSWLLAITLVFTLTTFAHESSQKAEAQLVNAKGEKIGNASFLQVEDELKVSIKVTHLPPGEHGIHFHETGLCTLPNFSTAGAHFNPEGKQHGLKNASGPHAGDLPNLKVDKDGLASTEFTTSLATLSPGKHSLLKKGGTSLIIHAKIDDQVTQPSGDSGDRIACGVIQSVR